MQDFKYQTLLKLINYLRPFRDKSDLLLRQFNTLSTKFQTLNTQLKVQYEVLAIFYMQSKKYVESI